MFLTVSMVDGDLSDIEALAEIKTELHMKKDVSIQHGSVSLRAVKSPIITHKYAIFSFASSYFYLINLLHCTQ